MHPKQAYAVHTYTFGAVVVACDEDRRAALMRALASKMELGTVDLLRDHCAGWLLGAEEGTRIVRVTLIGIVIFFNFIATQWCVKRKEGGGEEGG